MELFNPFKPDIMNPLKINLEYLNFSNLFHLACCFVDYSQTKPVKRFDHLIAIVHDKQVSLFTEADGTLTAESTRVACLACQAVRSCRTFTTVGTSDTGPSSGTMQCF